MKVETTVIGIHAHDHAVVETGPSGLRDDYGGAVVLQVHTEGAMAAIELDGRGVDALVAGLKDALAESKQDYFERLRSA